MFITYFILNPHQITTNNLIKVIQEYPLFNCMGVSDDLAEGMNSILIGTPNVVFINVDFTYLKDNQQNIFSYCNEIDKYLNYKPKYIALSFDTKKAFYALKNKFFDYLLMPGEELEIRKIILQLQKLMITVYGEKSTV